MMTLLGWLTPKTQDAISSGLQSEETLAFALDEPILTIDGVTAAAPDTANQISSSTAIDSNSANLNASLLDATRPSETGLSEEQAENLVELWLTAKGAAISADHDTSQLETILAGQALEERQYIVNSEQRDGLHADYEFSISGIEEVITDPSQPEQAVIVAIVNETANYYKNGQPTNETLRSQNLRVRYDLQQVDDRWKIISMEVIR
jgi:hypothetical protein